MFTLFGKKYPIRKLLFFLGEGLFLLFSLALVYLSRHGWDLSPIHDPVFWAKLLLISLICLLSLYYHDLYTFRAGYSYLEMAIILLQAIGWASVILGFLFFAFPGLMPGKWIYLRSILAFVLVSSIWRFIYILILKKGIGTTPLLLVGQGDFPEKITKEVRQHGDCGFKVAGIVWVKEGTEDPKTFYGIPSFNNPKDLMSRIKQTDSEVVVVAMDEKRGQLPVQELLECKMQGIPVLEGETFYEEITGKIIVDKINPSWLIFHEGFQKSWLMMTGKRVVAILASTVGLLVSLPVICLTAILIKLDSPGPVLFKQERVGKDGRVFTLVKFRSMRSDAEDKGAKWAQKNDDRVTRVGKIIRKLRIDEIPQMWNVLKGDMSFVGPRPERPVFVSQLREQIAYYDQRHTVQPGITGWAQINYPYGASVEDAMEKLTYDLYYIKHMSVMLDLYIILKTVKTILFREGAR